MRGRAKFDPDIPRKKRHDYWGIVIEAPDAHALARFYAELLGWEIASQSEDGAALLPFDGVGYLGIQQADDYVAPAWPTREGEQQMMMHLDFEVTDLNAAVAHARELGAVEADFQPQDNVRVMLDPAGHPFCLYQDE
ncbi:VOC family protein [Stackebrandtia nassauensis]|uniref:Glyoxalase/bleomycin resistance protein/dioxygenase n=1 Tax=Stackebrandtia nassauensis (strain DSM 44728 / CIP 108903 / NRRL B-16338 / NBRC 102104 / LLR-40K-21) TaxID=446470 RepID=D3Q022_STANL|nr:VOC family protein [Stackebrandtia nassauensis]ADD45551.1 Glyoxalase/bleomycin resistance protein/dioxygenase [Stackebrandtia nassauensis DSM 44728]